jgi:hypothetical protein
VAAYWPTRAAAVLLLFVAVGAVVDLFSFFPFLFWGGGGGLLHAYVENACMNYAKCNTSEVYT